jgi:hypothetical protein
MTAGPPQFLLPYAEAGCQNGPRPLPPSSNGIAIVESVQRSPRVPAGRDPDQPGPVTKYFAHWAMWFEVVMSWNGRQKAV